jgi:2-polyprenyl-3-methyl-5-hydroxy-6-metoxy-1,4-benzoquinol methylase
MNEPTEKTASYPCPVCSTAATRPRYIVDGFSIVACVSCGMVFVNPRIATDELFNLYRDEYFHRGGGSGYENYELTASLRIKTFGRWYADIKRFLPASAAGTDPGAGALDIGCAAGYFLDLLKKDGWTRIEGIELDTRMLQGLEARGFKVSGLPLEQFAPTRRYRLITLFDVLEHLPDINNDFEKLSAMLDENGLIALVTPDFNSFQRKLFGRRWFQFKPREHIYYFDPSTLRRLAEKHGFEIVHCSRSGQFADFDFLHDRLAKYRFPLFDRIFSFACTVLALKKSYWYMDTGSLFAILRKKK